MDHRCAVIFWGPLALSILRPTRTPPPPWRRQRRRRSRSLPSGSSPCWCRERRPRCSRSVVVVIVAVVAVNTLTFVFFWFAREGEHLQRDALKDAGFHHQVGAGDWWVGMSRGRKGVRTPPPVWWTDGGFPPSWICSACRLVGCWKKHVLLNATFSLKNRWKIWHLSHFQKYYKTYVYLNGLHFISKYHTL